jgi:MFS family permease
MTAIRAAAGRTFSSLRTRNFKLFFYSQLISNTGNWLTIVALTLLVLHLTHKSGLAVGALAACQFGPILFLSVWGGAIADRSDKRKVLYLTQSLEMAQSIVLACLAFMHHPPLAALYATAIAGGVFLAFDNPLRRSFVTEMVPADEVPNAVALYSALVNTSRIFGPALAGLLVVTLGYGWCFTIDAVSYVTVIAALWMMRPAELRRQPVPPKQKGDVRAALRYVAAMPNLWIPFVMLTVVGVLGYNFNVVLPLFVEKGLGRGAGAFTLVYALFSTGALVSALVVASHNLMKVRHIIIGAAAFGVAMLVMSVVPNIGFALPLVFLVGVTSILYMTATTAIVQIEADQAMHGRILALQTVLMVGTAPIGGPILGWISDAFGARAPIAVGGAASLAAAAWGWVTTRRLSRNGTR